MATREAFILMMTYEDGDMNEHETIISKTVYTDFVEAKRSLLLLAREKCYDILKQFPGYHTRPSILTNDDIDRIFDQIETDTREKGPNEFSILPARYATTHSSAICLSDSIFHIKKMHLLSSSE